MPPITIVFFLTGIAVWANALYFLGVGADKQEGSADPLKSVGWISLIAGLSNFGQAIYIMGARPDPLGDNAVLLAGLVIFYAAFFTFLGITEILGLDLRVLGNVSAAVAIVPLFYWDFFAGGWMFRSILVVWAVVFMAIALTTYGKVKGKVMGTMLVGTAVYTFWVPAAILAMGNTIP